MDTVHPGFNPGVASRRRFLVAANGGGRGGSQRDQAHHPRVCGGEPRPTRPLASGLTDLTLALTPTPSPPPHSYPPTTIDLTPTTNKTCPHLVRVGLAFRPLTPMSMGSADHQTSREHRPAEESQWRASACFAFPDLPVLSPFLAGRIGANAGSLCQYTQRVPVCYHVWPPGWRLLYGDVGYAICTGSGVRLDCTGGCQ